MQMHDNNWHELFETQALPCLVQVTTLMMIYKLFSCYLKTCALNHNFGKPSSFNIVYKNCAIYAYIRRISPYMQYVQNMQHLYTIRIILFAQKPEYSTIVLHNSIAHHIAHIYLCAILLNFIALHFAQYWFNWVYCTHCIYWNIVPIIAPNCTLLLLIC